jgi:hypothetical protein
MGEKVWPWQVQGFVSRLASEQAMTGPHEHGVFGCCRHCGAEDSSITLEECQSMGPVHAPRRPDLRLRSLDQVRRTVAGRQSLGLAHSRRAGLWARCGTANPGSVASDFTSAGVSADGPCERISALVPSRLLSEAHLLSLSVTAG